MSLIYLLSAVAGAFLSSFFVDWLYRLPTAPLSFPDNLQGKKFFRKIFFTIIYFSVAVYCEKMPPLDMFHHAMAAFFLAIIVVTDFEQYIIFDIVLIPFALTGFFFAVVLDLPLPTRLIAALCGGISFFCLMILTKNGIGGGDVKLVAALGVWLGTEGLLSTALTASILGGICALILILSGKKKSKDYFAYGPYFCLAAALQLVYGVDF